MNKKLFLPVVIEIIAGFLFCSCEKDITKPNTPPFIINSHVIWSSANNPIIVNKDIQVTENGILEIGPGTVIKFVENSVYENDPAGGYFRDPQFYIYGTFVCTGDSTQKIVFKSLSNISPYGSIHIFADTSQTDKSLIEWTELKEVWWNYGTARILNCRLVQLNTNWCKEVSIVSNEANILSIIGGEGIIEKNIVSESIIVQFDSTIIQGNLIQNAPDFFGGIRCANDSRALIINNTIESCGIALYIFSATPDIHFNNIFNNDINIVIIPDSKGAESDTINAIDNWWGLVDSIEIANKIEYRKNGNVESNKKVQFTPFATEPFDLGAKNKYTKTFIWQ